MIWSFIFIEQGLTTTAMVHIFCFELILLMEVRFGTHGSSNHPSLFFSPFGLNICEITQMISCTEHFSVYARGLDVAEWEMEFTQNIQGTPPKTSNRPKKTTPLNEDGKSSSKPNFHFFGGVFSCGFPHSSLPFRGFQLTLGSIGGSPSMKWNRSKHTRYHETHPFQLWIPNT